MSDGSRVRASRSTPRRRARRVGGAVLLLVGIGLSLDVAIDHLVGPPVVRSLMRRLPWEDATILVGSTRLSGLHRLTVSGLQVALAPPGDVLEIDSVAVEFSPRDLLSRPARLRHVRIAGARARAQRSRGKWSWLEPFMESSAAVAGPRVIVDRLELAGSDLSALGETGDRLLRVEELGADASSVVVGGESAIDVDHTRLRFERPGWTDGWLELWARAGLSGGVWQIRAIELADTAGGRVTITGSVGPGGPEGFPLALDVEGRDVRLDALHPAIARALPAPRPVRLDGHIRGTSEAPEIEVRVAPDSASGMRIEGTLRRGPGVATLELTADLEGLDTQHLDPRPPRGVMYGTAAVSLDLSRSPRPSGAIEVDMRIEREGGALSIAGRSNIVDGALRLDLRGGIAAGNGRIRGEVRPFDSIAVYDLEFDATLPGADAGTRPVVPWPGAWTVSLGIRGSGLTASTARATVRGTVGSADPARAGVDGTLRGQVEGGSLRTEATLDVGEGSLGGRLTLPLTDPGAWRMERLEWRSLPTYAWGIEGWLDAVSGSGRLAGVPGGVRGTIHVDSVGAGRLSGARGELDLDALERLTRVSGSLALGAATLEVERLDIVDGSPRAVVGTFRDLDPAMFLAEAPPASLAGRLTFEPPPGEAPLSVADGDELLHGRLELVGATLAGDDLTGGGDFQLRARELDFDLAMESAGQSLGVRGTALHTEVGTTARLRNVVIQDFDPRRWLGTWAPEGRLSAEGEGEFRNGDPDQAEMELDARFGPGRLGGVDFERAELSATRLDGRMSGQASATRSGRDMVAEASGEVSAGGHWRGSAAVSLRDARVVTAVDSFDARVDIEHDVAGDGLWRAALTGGGRLRGVQLDSTLAELEYGSGALRVDRLEVSGPALHVSGAGSLPLATTSTATATLELRAESEDLERLGLDGDAPELTGRARAVLRSTGHRSDLRHVLELETVALARRGVQTDSLRVLVDVRGDTTAWLASLAADAELRGPDPLRGGHPASAEGVALGTEPGGLVRLGVRWRADEPSSLRVTSAGLELDGQGWTLDQPAAIDWSQGVSFDELSLSSAEGRVRVAGRVGRSGEQTLELDLIGLPIRYGSDGESRLARALSGTLRMAGTSDAPTAQLEGSLERLTDTSRDVSISAQADGRGTRIQLEAFQRPRGRVTAAGRLPRRLSLRDGTSLLTPSGDSIDLHVSVEDLDVSPFASLAGLPSPDDLQGRLGVQLQMSGTEAEGRTSGNAVVRGFRARIPASGTDLLADRIEVEFDGGEGTIVEAVMGDGARGTVRLSGTVDLTDVAEPGLGLRADFENFEAVDNTTLEASVTGPVTVEGPAGSPRVAGSLHLVRGTYRIPSGDVPVGLEPIELTDEDYAELERRLGVRRLDGERERYGPWEATTLDLTVSATTNVWARRAYDPAVAAELAGDLRVIKARQGPLTLQGSLEVVEGRSSVVQFGRRFDLRRGTARFDGLPQSVEVEARAVYAVEDADIWIDVERNDEKLSLILGSDPSMGQNDIISYLASGRRATDVDRFGEGGADAASVGTDLALGRVTADVEEVARRQLGLDVVEIQQDGLYGLTLVAGRFVTPGLFVGVQQPVAFDASSDARYGIDQTEVNAEYRINPWLLTHLTGARSLFRVFLAAEYAR